ncbi:MAG: metallophosphoesterase [Pseudomonadota bacterium]
MTIYAIGDIHGQLDALKRTHDRIDRDRTAEGAGRAPIVHVGDFVDRGPNVRGTLDYMIARQAQGAGDINLKGNHDRMMATFLEPERRDDPLRGDLFWLDDPLGGRPSLASYGVDVGRLRRIARIHKDARAAVPQAHLDFLRDLRVTHAAPGLFFCHAGVRPGVPLTEQAEDDLVWIRREFLDSDADHGALIVHGHTPVEAVMHAGNHLNIDTGAGYGRPLSAVVIEGTDVFEVTESGRVPLPSPL